MARHKQPVEHTRVARQLWVPKTYEEALLRRQECWVQAIDEEVACMLEHGAWEERMRLPKGAHAIGCR